MITISLNQGGSTRCADTVDPAWLKPGSGVWVWVDLVTPTLEEARVLTDVFHFHDLAIEDALAEIHQPKIESYGDYLYVILHGIDFREHEHCFRTQDVDFFLGEQFLVTVHPGSSRTLEEMRDVCMRNDRALGEGPAALLHRIIDAMVDHYRPEVEKMNERLDALEEEVFERPHPELAKRILDFKADVSSLRRVVLPQRDAVARLSRREFPMISEQLSYRFRDVHDHIIRLVDEAMYFQDRVSSLLDAHLSLMSNQLNGVMKVLTIIATIFMPLTVLTGMWGMNVPLPHLPGGEPAQFWWVFAIMTILIGLMLGYFRKQKWI
ncbi:MAG TPA: magnesium/cobalt transporter CorA [Vicinamibacterales bacterium]|nr:magnesium/cobalt transporter CorA [Vicinamibacterales bacterium]